MKTLIVLLTLLACNVWAIEPWGMSIGTNAVKVAPERGGMRAQAWVSEMAVPQGAIVQHEGQFFMALEAIAESTTAPAQASEFRNLGRNRDRDVLVLSNASPGTIWLGVGQVAVVDRGIRLPTGSAISFDNIQLSVFAVSEVDGRLLTGIDVSK